MKLPYRAYGMARVVGDALYVTVDSGTGLIDTALRYDLRTGTSSTLFSAPADIAWLTVNDRWLVWESEKRLYAEPVGGGARRTLAASREVYGPALEGDIVAWVDRLGEGTETQIVTFNLRTGEKHEIARTHVAEYYNNFMQIRDGKLLWTDIYDGTGHYLQRDLATGETKRLSDARDAVSVSGLRAADGRLGLLDQLRPLRPMGLEHSAAGSVLARVEASRRRSRRTASTSTRWSWAAARSQSSTPSSGCSSARLTGPTPRPT